MIHIKLNLGCGPIFVDSTEWLNLDFSPASPTVRRANLLDRLPLANESAALVYSSHFFEHVPRAMVPGLLRECLRVLQPGGVLRLVMPDLENLAREYLAMREKGIHDKANFVVLEMIDQCVRREPGGELGRFYRQLDIQPLTSAAPMIDYVRTRTGENLRASKDILSTNGRGTTRRAFGALRNRMERFWIRVCLLTLPSAFSAQNVSLAEVGERHQWLWDFHQLKAELDSVGFVETQRYSAATSAIADFPFHPLDLDTKGEPRKGDESMYVEARKPRNLADSS